MADCVAPVVGCVASVGECVDAAGFCIVVALLESVDAQTNVIIHNISTLAYQYLKTNLCILIIIFKVIKSYHSTA